MTPNLQSQIKPVQRLRSVYLADDDADDREFFTDAIKAIDPSILLTEAQDGVELMEKLTDQTASLPELLFLDINMPGKSGFDCLEEIRKHDRLVRHLIVIMFSTSGDPQHVRRAKELGANYYAVKPCSFDKLKSFLAEVVERYWKYDAQDNENFRLI